MLRRGTPLGVTAARLCSVDDMTCEAWPDIAHTELLSRVRISATVLPLLFWAKLDKLQRGRPQCAMRTSQLREEHASSVLHARLGTF